MWRVNFNSELLTALLVGALSFLVCDLLFYRKRRYSAVKVVSICALHIYVCAVICLTLGHFLFYLSREPKFDFAQAFSAISWSPFSEGVTLYNNCKASSDMSEFVRIIGGNFIMLLPLGVLIPLVNRNIRSSVMFFISLAVPFAIEGLQCLGNAVAGAVVRDVSVSDFLLNALGCLLGYGIYRLFHIGKRGRKRKN